MIFFAENEIEIGTVYISIFLKIKLQEKLSNKKKF